MALENLAQYNHTFESACKKCLFRHTCDLPSFGFEVPCGLFEHDVSLDVEKVEDDDDYMAEGRWWE